MPPPIPSMPYAPKSLYTPRYADNIAQLLTRQGDIAAAGAARSGEIWGNTVNHLGQIAGQAVQGYAAHKEEQKQQKAAEQRQMMFEDAIGAFDPAKPMDSYRKLAVAVGPGPAMEFTKGLISIGNLQKPEATLEDFKQTAESLWRTKQMFGAEYLAQKWPELAPALQKGAEKFLPGADLSQLTPEILAGLDQLHEEFNPTKAGEPKVVGGVLVTPEGKELYRAPAKAEPSLADIEAEAAARARGSRAGAPPTGEEGTWAEAVGPDGQPILFNAKTGQTRPYPEGVKPKATAKERAVTGVEKTNLGFYNRAKQALDDITPIEPKVAGANLGRQAQLGYSGPGENIIKTPEQRAYRQAQRAFTEARLRKESGAAIPPAEYENDARTYFAQPGDDAKLIEQKRRARSVVLEGLRFSSGKAYEEFYGEPMPKHGEGEKDPLGIR